MRNVILFLLLFTFFKTNFQSQEILQKNKSGYIKIPQEEIFLHTNTAFFIPGEQLFYKIYCINSKNKALSKLSKIAYIEFIDKNLKVHFRHKIKLSSGTGQGDFFIPSSLTSGNYKLITYTKWMKNNPENKFYDQNISVFNPFLDNTNVLVSQKDSITKKNDVTPKNNENQIGNFVALKPNKNKFKKREKVTLIIDAINNNSSYGNYSISVRKKDAITIPIENPTSKTYTSKFTTSPLSNKTLVVPEFRGELISGKVIDMKTGFGKANVSLSLSMSGSNYIFKISKTNNKGEFYFNIDDSYTADTANLAIIDEDSSELKIQPDQLSSPDFSQLIFEDLKIGKEVKKQIESRSIQNQIENAYNTLKLDTVVPQKPNDLFFGNYDQYILDNFTRFKTLKETFTEVITNVYFYKKKDNYFVTVRALDSPEYVKETLVLIDGVQILNHSNIINFKTKQVRAINVVRENYIYANKAYKGIVDIRTFKGDYQNSENYKNSKRVTLLNPLQPKVYFNVNYEEESLNRIPDFRYQLFWKPDLVLDDNLKEVLFYTSDTVGEYEITLEGFTKNGSPVSTKAYFLVE